MANLCFILRTTGACNETTCNFDHDTTLFCKECGVWSPNRRNRINHLNGRKHLGVMRLLQLYGQQESGKCFVCEIELPTGPDVWKNHIESGDHRANIAVKISLPPLKGRCRTCNVPVPPSPESWLSHVRGHPHLHKLGPLAPRPSDRFCTVCNRIVAELKVKHHVKGDDHLRVEQTKLIIQALEQTERSKQPTEHKEEVRLGW